MAFVDCVGNVKATTAIAAQTAAKYFLKRFTSTLSPRLQRGLTAMQVFLTFWSSHTDHMVNLAAQLLPRWTIVTVTIEARPRQNQRGGNGPRAASHAVEQRDHAAG